MTFVKVVNREDEFRLEGRRGRGGEGAKKKGSW
jgi:hypothetical protein